jgi:hypothetical protein
MSVRFGGLIKVFLAVLLAIAAARSARAQTCQTPPTAGARYTWTQGTNVTVYVDPSIPGWGSQDFRNTVSNVFDAWDQVGGSDVSFTIVADAKRAHEPPANSIGLVQGSRNVTHLRPGAFNLGSAVISIDDYSGNPSSMRSPLSHEIGHTFGLDHCGTCSAGQSVMAPGGAPAPTPCDRRAIKENGGYFGIDVGGGRGERPENCQDCGVQNCTVTKLCRCPNRDCGVKEGRLVGDWQCTEMGRTCHGGGGCCRGDSGGVGSLSEPVCGDWGRAYQCEWGSVCCFDPALMTPPGPPTCEVMGWYDSAKAGTCEEVSGTTCTAVVLLGFSNYEPEPLSRECWQPDSGLLPSRSCGALGGDYCSQSGACPGGYDSLGASADCNPCCRAGSSCGALGGDYCSQSWSCPSGYASLGVSWDCSPCCKSRPSCGALGGDYCSQTDACPGGYASLGQSLDCSPCCKVNPPAPTPTPMPAGPSCGEMGGDYCSQSGACPGGYSSLGASFDCSPCCKVNPPAPTPTPMPAGPSCGEMGGDYCSQSGACPGGYSSLGASFDCNPCCKSQ